ncbi:MAG: hypothetical protein AB8B53_00785 [Flavobacteriales bacterium]
MKKILVVSILILVSLIAYAEKCEGTIIMLNNDTVECTFVLRNLRTTHVGERLVMYKKMEAIVKGKRKFYAAKDISGFTIKSSEKWFIYDSVNTLSSDGTLFMCREHDGEALLVHTCIQGDIITGDVTYHHVIRKKEEENQAHFSHDNFSVNGSLVTFFEDCPVILDKIESKEAVLTSANTYLELAKLYENECSN